jgi:beta-N-acetylhexosaminidase
MFGHLLLPAIDSQPASLSARWHEVLRKDLGFTGITITDDMLMLQHTELPQYADPTENAIAALNAGNTMLLYVLAADPSVSGVDPIQLVDALTAAVQAGRIPATTIDADALALLQLRRHLVA